MSKSPKLPRADMRFRCPICKKNTARVHQRGISRYPDVTMPQVGQLSQCDHCHGFVEYVTDVCNRLTLVPANARRVKDFKSLSEKRKQPTIPALIRYVMLHHRMPDLTKSDCSDGFGDL